MYNVLVVLTNWSFDYLLYVNKVYKVGGFGQYD